MNARFDESQALESTTTPFPTFRNHAPPAPFFSVQHNHGSCATRIWGGIWRLGGSVCIWWGARHRICARVCTPYTRRGRSASRAQYYRSALVGELLSKGAHSATVLSTRLKVRTYEPSTDLFSEMMRSVERSYFLVIVERELSSPLQ